ncbi:MAG: hypothetical protein NC489_08930 [Ruminococcus flavefaciens]|nr:hypothetical protein [Ruminococcus flavefaciens]
MSRRGYKIIAAIADVHIANKVVTASELKRQLKEHFFKPLEKLSVLDGILILGDITHTSISLNSDYSELFYWFINRVYKMARKKGALVCIIKGTPSHDLDHLSNLKVYVDNDDGVDFRIYDTVEEITLWDDYKVLVLPDVKVKQLGDIDQYLDEYHKYDMILGHGQIEQMQYVQQESENAPTKTYNYDVYKLMRASKGPVLFGHIHQYQYLNQKFYYVGPFTMLERGWQDAGFAIIGINDRDRTQFKVEHYINPDSADFYDIKVTKRILDEIPIDDIIDAIDDILSDTKKNDLITIRINRGSDMEASDKVMMIENRYRNDKRISIVKKVKSVQEAEREEEHEALMQKYSYLMDQSLELPVLAYQYYITDFKPMIPDQRSTAASLTEDDFRYAFEVES